MVVGELAKADGTRAGMSHHTVIRASAGTGKTHQLSSRYLRLLHAGHPVESILATTFTRKAAGEILERILWRLAKSSCCDRERRQLQVDLGDRSLTAEDCRKLLLRLTADLHRLRVSTLDSYFGQIARRFGLELGLPPAWDILEDHDDFGLRRLALHGLLASDESYVRELVHLLTKGEASRGISQLILTTVRDIYELYQESTPDGGSAWMAITPAPLLTVEQLSDVISALEAAESASTFRSARDQAVEDARQGDWTAFARKGLVPKILSDGVFQRKKIPKSLAAAYQPLIEHARGYFVHQLINQTQGAYHLAREFDQRYEQVKNDHQAILFNDVPQKLSSMANRPDTRRMAYRMDSHVDHMLLDEFQDTSAMQWNTLFPLARQITDSSDGSSSFFCVGDMKQAIYGWRGGQAEIIGSLDSLLNNLHVEELSQSRRSAEPVIHAVNQVFQNWRQHDDLGGYAAGFDSWPFRTHSTLKKESGYVCLQAAELDEEEQVATTLRCTARLIRDLHEQSPGHDIGVLVRRNQSVGQLIYYLRELQVSASEEGGNPLTDSAAVQQILSLLQMVDHPSDRIARFHVAHGPLAAEFRLHAENAHLREGGKAAIRAADRIREELVNDGYGPCALRWANLLARCSSRRELQRLEQLVNMAYAYQSRRTLRTIDFVRYVQTQRVADPSSAAVRVMTIHQSKGLEFDSVVLTALDETFTRQPQFVVQRHPRTFRPEKICRYVGGAIRPLLPADLQDVFAEDLRTRVHEYLCGLYVSMTRAKRSLHMMINPISSKKFHKSTAGLLRATLAPTSTADPGQILYELGDPHWFRAVRHDRERRATAPGNAAPAVIRLQLRKQGQSSERGHESTSPSQKSHPTLTGRDIFSDTRSAALEFGTLIHAWMESIVWLSSPPTETTLRNTAVQVGSMLVDVDEAIQTFYRILRRKAVARLLHQPDYRDDLASWMHSINAPWSPDCQLEVHNEQRVAYVEDGRLGTGSVDRLVLVRNATEIVAAEIIDWKTDPAETDEAAHEKCAHYAEQLQTYRQAVHEMFPIPLVSIRTRLVFLNAGRVEDV